MIRNGELTLAEVKRVFRRYWWIPVVATVVCGTLGFVATLVVPKKYTSSTMVLVEQPTVPTDIVKPVVTDDLNHRLNSMQEQILSRSRLQPIIEKFNLYSQSRGKEHMEDLVERLRKSIEVELLPSMPGSVNRQPPGFQISVTFGDGQLAQQICTEITSMFMEQNAKRREQQSSDTTHFLSQQLDEAKTRLDEQDAKLAQFKRQFLGSLPEEEQTNLNLLTGMNTQLEVATQALARAQQDKAFNETMLGQQEANWKATQSGQQNPETQEQQLMALEDQLTAMLSRYTPEHPDVVKLKTQIEDLKQKVATAPAQKPPSSAQANLHEPPQLQQLRAKVKQDELNIAEQMKRQAQIQEQIRIIQGRVQASPMVEQQFKELTRNYQTSLENYNDLLKKRQDSAMATDLEHQQESETFKVLDAPSLPLTPSFPKKVIFVGGGFGAGLALALGIMYLLAMNDKAMYTERDVEVCLKLPVLALVPSFDLAGYGAPAHKNEQKGSVEVFAGKTR
jgi:polysaccharide chain length determinant protein (PEP-CTERM system associated)